MGIIESMAFRPGLQRLLDGLALDDVRRAAFDRAEFLRVDRALAVDRLAEGVDHAAEQFFADGHGQHAPGALDEVAFGDLREIAEDHRADLFAVRG